MKNLGMDRPFVDGIEQNQKPGGTDLGAGPIIDRHWL